MQRLIDGQPEEECEKKKRIVAAAPRVMSRASDKPRPPPSVRQACSEDHAQSIVSRGSCPAEDRVRGAVARGGRSGGSLEVVARGGRSGGTLEGVAREGRSGGSLGGVAVGARSRGVGLGAALES